MIDVTGDFQQAVANACREKKIRSGIITGFTTGGVAALTTLEYEPGLVNVYHNSICGRQDNNQAVAEPYADGM